MSEYYTTELESDSNGDLVLPLDQNLLAEIDWREGDVLEWDIEDEGVILRNISKNNRD